MLVLTITGCSTLKDSLVLGAGTGVIIGGIAGSQNHEEDRTESTLKGAVIGGVIGGIASYLVHGSLESRDTRVRRDTLMNLEKFDVMGREINKFQNSKSSEDDKCFTSHEIDGREVLIPCRYLKDSDFNEGQK